MLCLSMERECRVCVCVCSFEWGSAGGAVRLVTDALQDRGDDNRRHDADVRVSTEKVERYDQT